MKPEPAGITKCPTCGWTPPPPPLCCEECGRPLDLPADREAFLRAAGWEPAEEGGWREPRSPLPKRQIPVGRKTVVFADGTQKEELVVEEIEGDSYQQRVQVGYIRSVVNGIVTIDPVFETRTVTEFRPPRQTLTEEAALRRQLHRLAGPLLAAWWWHPRYNEEEIARLALDRHGNFFPVKAQALRALRQAISLRQCSYGHWPQGFVPRPEMVVAPWPEYPLTEELAAPVEPPPLVARLFGLGKESTDVS